MRAAHQMGNVAIALFWALLAVASACADDATADRVNRLIAHARFDEAQTIVEAELRLQHQAATADKLQIAYWQNELGLIAQDRGRIKDAIRAFSEALRLRRQTLGRNHPDTAILMNNLATMLTRQGRHDEALSLLTDALRINRANRGPLHSYTVTNISNLGLLNLARGRYAEAERGLKDALTRTVTVEGGSSRNASTSMHNLASCYITTLQLEKAERLLSRALAVETKMFGENHPAIAASLNNLGELKRLQGNFVDAEQAYLRAAAIDLKVSGPESTDYAIDQTNLAALYQETGRHNAAHEALAKASDILARSTDHDAATASVVAADIARLLKNEGRLPEATALYLKSLRLNSLALGPEHPDSVPALTDLARMHAITGNATMALEYGSRAINLVGRAFGYTSPQYARASLSHAFLLSELKEQSKAMAWAQSSRNRIVKDFGARSLDAGTADLLIARLALQESHLSEAEASARSALSTLSPLLPPTALQIADTHDLLGRILLARGDWQNAFIHANAAFRILSHRQSYNSQRVQAGYLHTEPEPGGVSERLLHAAFAAGATSATHRNHLPAAFEAAEAISADREARALAQGSIKFHASDAEAMKTLRRHQVLLAEAFQLDRQIIAASASYSPESNDRVALLNARARQTHAEIFNTDTRLRQLLPAYAAAFAGKPVTLQSAQASLKARDLVLYVLPASEQTFVMAVTRSSATLHVAATPSPSLQQQVDRLRAQLDPARWKNSFEPFDRELAHKLFNELFEPLKDQIDSSATIYAITSGPLQSLPLGVLVTEPPAGGVAGNSSPDLLRATQWLAKNHAIVSLPSFASLQLLRGLRDTSPASDPFLGIGAPALRQSHKPRLPSARRELEALNRLLGSSVARNLLTGSNATKAAFLQAHPGDARVIAFATHSVPGRELDGSAPGLVLSDDGSNAQTLTSGEIADLDLRADWIILSACSTAGEGSSSMQTLVQAFFRAGAKSILASHWSLSDRAAGLLTVSTLRHFRSAPADGQAVALQRAMAEIMMDKSNPLNAHPSTWGAFSLIGEAYPKTDKSAAGSANSND